MKAVVTWCVLALCLTTVNADDKTAWREKLDTAIPEGIRMLEAKEYVPFLKAFVEPEQLKQILSQGSIEEFSKHFADGKADLLLKLLKKIKDAKPKMEKNDTQATYDVDIEGVSKKSITFRKTDKFWYIAN